MDQPRDDAHLALVAKLSARVADSAGFLDALAAECAEHILSAAPLRAQVAFAAAQVIQARMAMHADAVGRIARVSAELDEDWRIAQGGKGGGPTPTKDLLGMAAQAHAEIAKAEDMVLKAARLALDEQKAADEGRTAPGFVYSGAAESIPVPQDLSAADREGLRALMGNLQRYVAARREVIDVTPEAAPAITMDEPTLPTDPVSQGASDPVIQEPAADPLAMTTEPPSRSASRRRRRSPS